MLSFRTAAISLLILASVGAAACGIANASSSHPDGQPVIDETSSARTQGSQTAPDATAPDTDIDVTTIPETQDSYPRVLWMFVDDSSADISIVHFATNVPTTASIYDANLPGHHLQLGHAEDPVLATEHTMPIAPGPNGAFNLAVSDASRHAAYAELRISPAVADSYFVDGVGAPKLSLNDGLHGLATWETQLMTTPRPSLTGTALVFENAFACKQGCANHPVSTGGDQPVEVNAYTDQHTVGFMFPDRTHDYVVVVGGVSDGQHGSSEFYQFEVSGSDLPR